MKRFKSPQRVRWFCLPMTKSPIFFRNRNKNIAAKFRAARTQAFTASVEVTGVAMAA